MASTTKTAKIATDLGRVNADARGNQRLYRLDPPMTYTDWCHGDDCTEVECSAEYVVVSAVVVFFSGPETYIFQSDDAGNITNWGELEGSYRGGLDHERALNDAGYTIRARQRR